MVSVNRDDLETSPRRRAVASYGASWRGVVLRVRAALRVMVALRVRAAPRVRAICLLAAFVLSAGPVAAFAANVKQIDFASPEQAVAGLVAAARADKTSELVKILGPDGRRLVFSGDPIADKNGRASFAARFDEAHKLLLDGNDKAALSIGKEEWPFPIPIVKVGERWRFDTKAGAEEILVRRIGRNELDAIEVGRAYVDAQRDYATTHASGSKYLEYAQKFMSTRGKHDGLYWPVTDDEAPSPMGPLMARARAEGYDGGREPYHGYYYKILTKQGANAHGGAYDYMVRHRMIGGFALVAFPAKYGDSGVMTFVVNQDGIVYQKDLGPRTAEIARRIAEFDPDSSWTVAK